MQIGPIGPIIGAIIGAIIGFIASLWVFLLSRSKDRIRDIELSIKQKESLVYELDFASDKINSYLNIDSTYSPNIAIERLKQIYISGSLPLMGDKNFNRSFMSILLALWLPETNLTRVLTTTNLKTVQDEIKTIITGLEKDIVSDKKEIEELKWGKSLRGIILATHHFLIHMREEYCYKKATRRDK
ncbi:MAG: hypothetical protein V1701_05190 [Planctomycetota bacterium]